MSSLAERIVAELQAGPRQFSEIVDAFPEVAWRDLLRAWGEVRQAGILGRDEDGHYLIAAPPGGGEGG